MADPYQIVAFILTALLLPAFGHLYLRFRDARTLLWFLGFLFAMVRMLTTYKLGAWDLSAVSNPWIEAAGQTSIQISSALFLASLSPARFRIGQVSILYVIPFAIPLVAFSIFLDGVFHGVAPSGRMFLIFPILGLLSVFVGFLWGIDTDSTPAWVGGSICGTAGVFAVWLLIAHGPNWSLTSVESSTHLVTAMLVIFVFRRFSPGVF